MRCPVCSEQLTLENEVYSCLNKHGGLVSGKFLRDIEQVAEAIEDLPSSSEPPDMKKDIVCPHCSALMHKVNYNNTGVVIDSCSRCQFRWLDAGEVKKIKGFKPKFRSEDILFIEELDRKTNSAKKEEIINPRIPLFNAIRVVSAGDSRRTQSALLGMGLYGVITGMIKSKFLRFVIPPLLAFFALAYFLVIKYFEQTG